MGFFLEIDRSELNNIALNYYKHYSEETKGSFIERATRDDCAYLCGRSLLAMIPVIAIIGPITIFESCKSFYKGEPNYPLTRLVTFNIIINAYKAYAFALGILFPVRLNQDFLQIDSHVFDRSHIHNMADLF